MALTEPTEDALSNPDGRRGDVRAQLCASRRRALHPDRVCHAAKQRRCGPWRLRRSPPAHAHPNPRSISRQRRRVSDRNPHGPRRTATRRRACAVERGRAMARDARTKSANDQPTPEPVFLTDSSTLRVPVLRISGSARVVPEPHQKASTHDRTRRSNYPSSSGAQSYRPEPLNAVPEDQPRKLPQANCNQRAMHRLARICRRCLVSESCKL